MIGRPRIHVAECDSTQLLLAPDAPEGAIATTDHQTAGRGRLGRRWLEAPSTSVLASVLLRPPPERRAPELSLVAALATARALEEAADVRASVKWPNDVLLEARKVAGILAELRSGAVVLGIGVNVNQTCAQLPAETTPPAASLRTATGREHDREHVLELLLEQLDVAYASWRELGLAAVRAELAERDALRGRRVVAGGTAGVASGIDDWGRLLLETPTGHAAVESGEVLLEE